MSNRRKIRTNRPQGRVCDGCARGEHPGGPHCRGCGALLGPGGAHPLPPWCPLMVSALLGGPASLS